MKHLKSMIAAVMLSSCFSVAAAPIVLDFEGAGNSANVLNFYNGGTDSQGNSGANLGINFASNALSLIQSAQGGSGNFTLWKISNATSEDNYASGTNLGSVGNVKFRFLQAVGFKIVIRDNTTGFRQVVPMDKGDYTRGLVFGDQVQLAQSQEVTQINTKVDILAVDLSAIKGTGFTKDTHSLINIKNDTKKALTVPKYLALK
jgi:hypothetical protein